MRKPIFENKKEACEFWFDVFGVLPFDREIKAIDKAGFIRRSPVEEAEEMYKNYRGDCDTETFHLIQKQHEAIQYLIKQLEKTEEK